MVSFLHPLFGSTKASKDTLPLPLSFPPYTFVMTWRSSQAGFQLGETQSEIPTTLRPFSIRQYQESNFGMCLHSALALIIGKLH